MPRINDQDIIAAANARKKALPNEPFPVLVQAVARFVNADPEIVEGTLWADLANQGAG